MAITAAPEKTNATDEPEMEEGSAPNHSRAVLVGILLLTGAVVLLIFGYLTITYRRGGMILHRDHAALRGWGLPRHLMGDAHPANPAGTWGSQMPAGSMCYTQLWDVPMGQVSPCLGEKGSLGPARPS